jgi:UDP-3-O-[3-hydroxymyristoyl] N-acetylglucosamine deacetylase
VVFVRKDLAGFPRIPASIEHRVATPRRTSLRCGAAGVDMIEHVIAALYGLGIDNCEVWVDQPEMPGLDGSAQPFVAALDAAGIVEQNAWRVQRIVREPIRLGNEESWIEAWPIQGSTPVFRYKLDYGSDSPIGRQSHETPITPEIFRKELAPCRTFMLKSEAQWLLAQGIGCRASARDLLIFGEDGPIENEQRFDNECARHKLMDMIGDLALAGSDLIGRFSAYRSGHRLNAELVRALLPETEAVCPRRRCA